MAKSGHHFPAKHGFKNSTGKVQNVSGYTRAVPKAKGGPVRPVGMSGPKMIPQVQPKPYAGPRSSPKPPPMRQAPVMRTVQPVKRGALAYAEGGFVKQGDGTMKTSTIGDQGNAAVKRGNPATSEAMEEYGGKGPLLPGYKKGGLTKAGAAKVAKAEVAKHVARPAPKGHKGFSKTPMFGKK